MMVIIFATAGPVKRHQETVPFEDASE